MQAPPSDDGHAPGNTVGICRDHLVTACKLARDCYPRYLGTTWDPASFTPTVLQVDAGRTTYIAFPGTCHPKDWELDAEFATGELKESTAFKVWIHCGIPVYQEIF